VRNHAQLLNIYLNAYTKAKGFFSNKKKIAQSIVEDPFRHRIYQDVSFMNNVSRYDLPDPEVYREFFKQNKLYEFKKFDDLCTYFKGCPHTKLDVAIAYDFAEILEKYNKEINPGSSEVTSQESTSEEVAASHEPARKM
jgi:hypothetical protein